MPCSRSRSATSRPAAGLRHALEDRIDGQQGIAREEHLRDQPLRVRVAEQREVDVRRPPSEGVVLPRIRAGLDRHQPIATLVVGQSCPSRENSGRGGVVIVDRMRILSGSVGLPHFDQRPAHRLAVSRPARGRRAPSSRRGARSAPGREIGLAVLHEGSRKRRSRRLERTRRHAHQRLRRRPQARALVVGVEVGGERRRRVCRPSASLLRGIQRPSAGRVYSFRRGRPCCRSPACLSGQSTWLPGTRVDYSGA